jgi:hypothetical protein
MSGVSHGGPSTRAATRIFDGALAAAAALIVLTTVWNVVHPIFTNVTTLGGHDWDEMEAQRWLVVKSIREFHQFPFWNPYACGGFSAWGAVESDTTVISPFLPVYLFAPLHWAVRIEVLATVLVSALGAWLLAGRFTRSAALRALVCIAFAVNGRWSLQAATGHAWHLYYAYTPWILFFYDRAARGRGPFDAKSACLASLFVAMMVYSGAIYPLPQTVFLVGVYAIVLAILEHDLRPLTAGAAVGAIAAGLSAPKLVSMVENMLRWPRVVDSTESIDLHAFVQMLIERNQDTTAPAAAVSQWGWQEYGLYIGWAPALLILVGLIFARDRRARALRWAALVGLALGFGRFHNYSPWAELHELPLFKSQHVPTRWLYPAVLLSAVVAASSGERLLVWLRLRALRRPVELALVVMVMFIGRDVADVVSRPLTHAFWMQMRTFAPVREFYTVHEVPPELQYVVGDYAPPGLPATLAGVDVLRCTLHPGLNIFAPSAKSGGRPMGMGAVGKDDADYHGEAYIAGGHGTAHIASFSPNRVEVDFTGVTPGDLVVLNENWDAGWNAGRSSAIRFQDVVAFRAGQASGKVVFWYRPRFLGLTTALALLTIAAIAAGFGLKPEQKARLLRWARARAPVGTRVWTRARADLSSVE